MVAAAMDYPAERFSDEEKALLEPHFTNLDKPVFALVNLPETVKGAMFARYSRYPGTLRRLFLDEFAGDLEAGVAATFDGQEGQRARKLYENVFLGYGDDSVAQLGGAHIATEWVSNIMTKVLQRGRLAAYLEQSTRYIAYDAPMPGGGSYRYWRDPSLGPEYESAMDALFDAYAEALPRVKAWASERFPRGSDEAESAHDRSIKAKALDLLRGLLPAASLSHVGIFASGQAYEQLLLRLLASSLPEAQDYARMILAELKEVMPSFVARVDRPDRGGEWIRYLEERGRAAERWASRLGLARADDGDQGPRVRLLRADGSEDDLLAALVFEAAAASGEEALKAVRALPPDERATMLADLVGERRNRRHRPGRGFEALRYRFEVVSDYGAFRDLQRHRLLTIQWQPLTPDLGAGVPEELEQAGVADAYRAALERSREEYARLVDTGRAEVAPYALSLGYRIRYVLDMNAREAMHVVELRSGREGHPTYRAVAHAIHSEIARVHPSVAAAMTHVDADTEPRLERILSEIRTHARQTTRA
jgi:thymidylate synthase ThyX